MSILRTEREDKAIKSAEADAERLTDQASRDRVADGIAKNETAFNRLRRENLSWSEFRDRIGK